MSDPVRRLAAEIVGLRNRIDGLGSGPQLAFSSIEAGAIDEYDKDGNLVGSVGEQWDGTHGAFSLSGPPPPRPEAPTIESGTTVSVGWSGSFVNPDTGARDIMITAPMDWARAEIHLSQYDGFVAETADTLVDTIETPRGGTRPALPGPGVWYAVLVARSLSGKRSEQSAQTRFEVLPGISEEDIQEIRDEFTDTANGLSRALNDNVAQQTQLRGAVDNLRDETLPALETELGEAATRLDAADQLLNVTFPKWISDAEAKAHSADTKAGTAVTTAGQASTKATAAETAANSAQTKAATAAADAATAATKATAAETSATNATGAAGTAETAADKARQDAAAALTQATNSGSNANAAQAAANAAKAASDTAKVEAAKAGTAAAAADAAAASAAADAAQAAADLIVARNTAEDASEKADTAIERADGAVTAAGSAARVLYSTGNPTGTARVGDTWRKTNGDAGDVIGEWRYTKVGTAAASWKPQKVTTEMISNLDVGKLTAGTAAIVGLVAEKIAASTATIQKADIGNLTVAGTTQLNEAVAVRIAANVGQFIALSTDQLTAGTASLGTAVADKLFAGIFASNKIYTSQMMIGHPGNVLPDPMFLDPKFIALRNEASTCLVAKSGPNLRLANTGTGNTYFRPLGVKQDTVNYKDWISVVPGEVWQFEMDTDAFVGNGSMKFVGRSLNGQAYKNPPGATALTPGNAHYVYKVEIPADCYWICPEITVPPGTSYILAGSLVMRQVITPALVVDGLVSGQNIIGAIIQTEATANRGVKINEAGLFAYSSTGVETLRFDASNSIITGATMRTAASGTRIQISTSGGLEGWNGSTKYLTANATGLTMIGSISSSGMTFEPTPRPINIRLTSVSRPGFTNGSAYNSPSLIFDDGGSGGQTRAAGIYSPDGETIQVNGRMSTTTNDPMGILTISRSVASLLATSIQIGNGGTVPSTSTKTNYVALLSDQIRIDAPVLDIIAPSFKINGVLYGDSSTRERVAIASTWTHHTGSSWNGLWIEQMGKLTIISGAVARSNPWGNGALIATLPAKYRPSSKVWGAGCEVETSGSLITNAGSVAVAISIMYFAA